MSKSSFVDFKAIKAAVRMEQVLEHYDLSARFKKYGDSLSGPCPIHQGTNPTQFRVSLSKNIWNCFSECKHGGNVLDFIAKMENVSIHAAALKALRWFGLDPALMSAEAEAGEPAEAPMKSAALQPKSALTAASALESKTPNKPLQFRLDKLERNHPYLAERGLTSATIEEFGIGFCAKGMMAGRIAIRIHNVDGNVVAYAGRFPGEPSEDTPKYKLPPGFRKSLELFNLDRAVKEPSGQPLVLVEGFFDCMLLHQHGCRKVVALMGSSMSVAQEDLIRRHTIRASRIILMLDEDEGGRSGREEMAVRLAQFAFVTIHVFEKEGQQPSDLTVEEVQNLLVSGSLSCLAS